MDKFLIRKPANTACDEISKSTTQPEPHLPAPSTSAILKQNKNVDPNILRKDISDISANGEKLLQHKLLVYPKNKGKRSFQAEWFQRFKWLEYSKNVDAAFCYPCRQFCSLGSKENAFTSTGFRNWKMALSKDKGFEKHASSETHIMAVMMWREKDKREENSLSVSTMLNDDVLERHRYYIKSIAEVIQFLAVNELAFRGAYDIEEHHENGLFRSLFEYTLVKDSKLAECVKYIPANATYLSPEIQNNCESYKKNIISN